MHPTLAAMMAEWKLGGRAAMMGRHPHPEPNDLIVPMPPEHAARRPTRTGEAFRGHDYSVRALAARRPPGGSDRHRRHYDMRATFITLALNDGADQHVIETRVPHTKKRRSALDGYNRGLQWERTCAEIPHGWRSALRKHVPRPPHFAAPPRLALRPLPMLKSFPRPSAVTKEKL